MLLVLMAAVAVVHVAAPTILYFMLYPLAPAKSTHVSTAEFSVTLDAAKPETTEQGGAGVLKSDEAENALIFPAPQFDCT